MGVVYKARHLTLKRTVALKMMLAGGHAGPRELARFQTEAEAVARFQHPNIVQIHEVGEAEGYPYCALEFVEGGSLADKLTQHPMPPQEAATLLETLARAVQLAHSRNVVHRDLKPANVLLTVDGTPKITDFGLARQTDHDSGETQAGMVVGTPSFMAPEQASGQAHQAGPAVDVYALGAILYTCLTSQPPFKGKTVVETLDQVRTQEPGPISRWQNGVPLDLETICLKCLRKEPENRYASAAELADDLQRYRRGEPILARPVGRVERAIKWVKRNPVVSGAVLAVALALTLGAVVSYLKYLDAEVQKGIAVQQSELANDRERQAHNEAARAKKAEELAVKRDQESQRALTKARRIQTFLISILEMADVNGRRGTMTARQILDDAERRIPTEFADQPELRTDLYAAVDAVYAKITANAPVAMILEANGSVQLQRSGDKGRQPKPQTLLYAGDRLILGANANVQLIILNDMHKERLKPSTEVAIRRKGCEPGSAVAERKSDPLMTFVRLPKATFYMGWTGAKKGVKTEIKEDFEIAVHPVTQWQWQTVMGNNPSYFSRAGNGRASVQTVSDEELKLFPVECVSWNDAQEFIKKLNQLEKGKGYRYRLPREAEWEYACRGGATSERDCSFFFYFDKPTNEITSHMANYDGTQPFFRSPAGPRLGRTSRVGAYPPNPLGLCDMHGNVWQWCEDVCDLNDQRTDRVYRGGCWNDPAMFCCANLRLPGDPQDRIHVYGFRLVRVPTR
jgi:formylglycine-generating enzyme required for sulfatase activity